MDMPHVVDPIDVNPAWMTHALRAAGSNVEIISLDVSPGGVGQVGETYRCRLHYAGAPPAAAPATIIGKFHSSNADSRTIASQLNLYRQDYMFYRELAVTSCPAAPKPYLVLNEGEDRFVILLQDFAPAQSADHLAGITFDQAHLAVLEAAKFHASHWGDEALKKAGG